LQALLLLVGVTDLQRLLELKTPAVVTNWRTRASDFPADRSDGTQPKYNLLEVLTWLRDSGPRGTQPPSITPKKWWELSAKAFHRQANVPSTRRTMVALVLLWHQLLHDHTVVTNGGRDRWQALVQAAEHGNVGRSGLDDMHPFGFAELLRDTAQWAELAGQGLRDLIAAPLTVDRDAAALLADLVTVLAFDTDTPPWERMRIVLRLPELDRRTRTQLRSTYGELARVMAAVAAPKAGNLVLDPAAGEAGLLSECWFLEHRLQLVGQEIHEGTMQVAKSRLRVSGIDVRWGEPGADSVRDDPHRGLRADVVVVDPPIGDDAPPLTAWLDHGLQHLTAEGTLVITLPAHELVPVPSARRREDRRLTNLITGLAEAGNLDALVVLPRGIRDDVVGPLVVCRIALGRTPTERGPRTGVVTPGFLRSLDAWQGIRKLIVGFRMMPVDGMVRQGLDDGTAAWATPAEVLPTLARLVDEVERAYSSRTGSSKMSVDAAVEPPEPRSTEGLDRMRRAYEEASRQLAKLQADHTNLQRRHELLRTSTHELLVTLEALDLRDLGDADRRRLEIDRQRVQRDLG
jgi:hypothetical protein